MDIKSETFLFQYRENLETYEKIREIVLNELNRICNSQGMVVRVVEARIKTEDSMLEKLARKGFKYRSIMELTDLVGARVVTLYEDEVDRVAQGLEATFDVDWENSVDKRKTLEVDRVGYMSLHYILRVPKSLYEDPDMPLLNTIRFEVQIRTMLQHVWANVFHDTGYKSDIEVPREYIRSLNRMAGLLEIADDEFRRLRDDIDIYREHMRELLAQGRLDEIELNGEGWRDYVKTNPLDSICNRISESTGVEFVTAPLSHFLSPLLSLGFSTIGQIDKVIADYSDKAVELTRKQLDGKDIDIMTCAAPLRNVILIYLVEQGAGQQGIVSFLEDLKGSSNMHVKTASRTMKLLSEMGIEGPNSPLD